MPAMIHPDSDYTGQKFINCNNRSALESISKWQSIHFMPHFCNLRKIFFSFFLWRWMIHFPIQSLNTQQSRCQRKYQGNIKWLFNSVREMLSRMIIPECFLVWGNMEIHLETLSGDNGCLGNEWWNCDCSFAN